MKIKTPMLPGTKATPELILNDALIRAQQGEVLNAIVVVQFKSGGVGVIYSDTSGADLIHMKYMADLHLDQVICGTLKNGDEKGPYNA